MEISSSFLIGMPENMHEYGEWEMYSQGVGEGPERSDGPDLDAESGIDKMFHGTIIRGKI